MRAYYADRISANISRTPEGYLICKNVPIARTGWQNYRASEIGLGASDGYVGDEIIKVYRDSAEVFHPATMASFEGKTITSPHPPTFLTPSNDSGYNRGHLQNIRRGPALADGESALLADLIIKDSRLIDQVWSKTLREVSCGYDTLYEPLGDRQYRQTEIRGNHVAVVPTGRAGSQVRILDAKGEEGQVEEGEMKKSVFKLVMDELAEAKEFFKMLGWKQPTADSDPGAVERNAIVNAEALERARRRNEDEMAKTEEEKSRQAADEALPRIATALDGITTLLSKQAKDAEEEKKKDKEKEAKDAKDAKDAEEKEEKEKKEAKDRKSKDKKNKDEEEEEMEDAEDADLIPVATLKGDEIPHNPIPGADKALDELRALRPLIAKGTSDDIANYNRAILRLKGKEVQDDGTYGSLARPKKPENVLDAENSNGAQRDRVEDASDFVEVATQFHRKNVGEVKIERKEKK